MIAVAWVLLSGVAWCLATPLSPAAAALETPSSAHTPAGGDAAEVPQEKRLLKYFLPGSSSWVPTQQEGTKRGYSRNYLRFGRSEEDKRGGRNFLRFGRGDSSSSSIEDLDTYPDAEDSIEKRNRNFLRFGRDRNFLRFGRSDAEDFALPGGPLAFSNSVQEDDLDDYPLEEKRAGHRNYLRFGRGNRNFLRFGRDDSRNFLRFGRSVDRQLNEQKPRDIPQAPATAAHASAKSQESHRTKRAAGAYNYVVMPAHGPAAWAQDLQPETDEDLEEAVEGPDVTKRSYNRSFLRFGRDRNFLRFGKRSDDDASEVVLVKPASYPRYVRAPQRNFLRFG